MGSATLYADLSWDRMSTHRPRDGTSLTHRGRRNWMASAGRPEPGPEAALPPSGGTLPHLGQFPDKVMSRTCLLFTADATAGAGDGTCLVRVFGPSPGLIDPLPTTPTEDMLEGRAVWSHPGAQPAEGNVLGTPSLAEDVITLQNLPQSSGTSERASIASWRLASVPRFLVAKDVERVIDSCTGHVFELRDRA